MILFILNILIALGLGIITMKGFLSNRRGTNSLTRFVRDTYANHVYTSVILIGIGVGVVFCLVGSIFDAMYAGLPTLLISIVALVLSTKSAKNKQRVEDARKVTKGSLKVTGQVAETGAVVAAGYFTGGNPAAMKAAKSMGKVTGSIADSCADSMTDVDCPKFNVKEVLDEVSPDKLIAFAERSGIQTENRDLSAVATDVVTYMPSVYKEKYPNLDPVKLAVKVANGGK